MAPPERPALPMFASMAPHHQAALAALAVASLLALVGDRAWHAWRGAPLVNVEQGPRHSIELRIDVNRAAWPELALLPNIGEALAKRIVAAREQDGPFTRAADLRRVRGIGPKTLERMEPYLAPLP